ncbi:MAG: type II toxin-antitoxin system HicB family antitoxin [Pyrinomonadaceae bacterium]
MAKLNYPFVVYPAVEGGYVGEVPALEGCLAQGETLEETLKELEIVERIWLETARESGVAIPVLETEIERVQRKMAA